MRAQPAATKILASEPCAFETAVLGALCQRIPICLVVPGWAQTSSLRLVFLLVPPLEWISDCEDSVLDPEALRVEVNTFMEAYDQKIAEVGIL